MAGLVLLAGWGALAFGAVYEWAYPPLLLVAALVGGVAWTRSAGAAFPRIAAAAAATLAAILLQLVPIDADVLARVSPGTHRILMQTDVAYAIAVDHALPARHPMSVAPALTIDGVWFLLCGAMLTLGTARWLTRDRLRRLAAGLVVLGALLAVIGLVQRVISPRVIYGFWVPEQGITPFGPFVNKNHFAGWMVMALPLVLGLAAGMMVRGSGRAPTWRARLGRLSRPETAASAMTLLAAFMMTVALLLTLSRSGIVSAAMTLAVAALVTPRFVRGQGRRLAIGLALLALAAAVWAGTDRLADRFGEIGSVGINDRAGMWTDTWRMAAASPVFGIGIRAYTRASFAFQSILPGLHVSAAHNDWLQLIAEGGLLVGIPAAWLLVELVREGARRFRDHGRTADYGTSYWIRAGAAGGLFGIGLQSLVEFSLQMPGNTILFALLWAIVIAPLPVPTGHRSHPLAA